MLYDLLLKFINFGREIYNALPWSGLGWLKIKAENINPFFIQFEKGEKKYLVYKMI